MFSDSPFHLEQSEGFSDIFGESNDLIPEPFPDLFCWKSSEIYHQFTSPQHSHKTKQSEVNPQGQQLLREVIPSQSLLSQQKQQPSFGKLLLQSLKPRPYKYVHKRKRQQSESLRLRPSKKCREDTTIIKVIFTHFKNHFVKKDLFNAKLLDQLLRKLKISASLATFELIFWFAEKTGYGSRTTIQGAILNSAPYLLNLSKALYPNFLERQHVYEDYVKRITQALYCGSTEQERMRKLYPLRRFNVGMKVLENLKQKLTIELEKVKND